MIAHPAVMKTTPIRRTTRGSAIPRSAAATNGAAVPRMPIRSDCAVAYSPILSRGAICTTFVKNVISPPAFTIPLTTATGMRSHTSAAAMYPIGTSSVTTVFRRVRRIEDPRSIIRPHTRYATIIVADETAAIAPTNEFDALKWSTSRIG